MNNWNFTLVNYHFHIYKDNRFIFRGYYRDDNPDGRSLKVFLDDKEVAVIYEIKKGIDIRQKYLPQRANISEEIIGIIDFEDWWKKAKKLYVYCYHKGNQSISLEVTVKELIRSQKDILGNVENISCTEGKISIIGWAADKENVELKLYRGKELVPCTITRGYRKDIKDFLNELPEGYLPGFKVEIDADSLQGLRLYMKAGDREKSYPIRSQKGSLNGNVIQKALRYLQHYGIESAINKGLTILTGNGKRAKANDYHLWRKKYEVTTAELEEQKKWQFDLNPKFSVVIPLYKTKPQYLRELIESIQAQTYFNWELCLADGSGKNSPLKSVVEEYSVKDSRIKYKILTSNKGISENTNVAIEMAEGKYIVFADHDDIVSANALFECTKAINEDATIDVIYSDEDKIDMDGKKFFDPHFKSDFNIDLLCSMNYICHLFVVKREVIDKVGMLRCQFDGAQDHDFILRCCEVAQNIKHIPMILYHWRCHSDSTAENPENKRYAFEAGRKAVEEHYKRVGIPATVEHAEFYGMFRTKYHWIERPLISIIIPNKDHIADLVKIMDSIENKSTYHNYEFIIVENNSTEKETFDFYKEIEKKEHVQVFYYEGDFNFSRINNFGVSKAKGEYLLLLNNDTEIITPECLEELLHICMRKDVGIVGAKLCYHDDTIQHAGVVIGFGGIAGHTFIGSSRYDSGYFSRIICVQDYSAVTAACMMTKREVYEQVGGLSEDFKVAFNDIDYCMKVRNLGKLVVYTPYAELYHYESKSRGLEDTPEKIERFNSEVALFIEKWENELKAGDPYYNCNLSLDKSDFSLKD